ncbi:hypothetical protein MRY82_03380 [bacterium]|nr:hypothetical protein [bacterium]
MKHNLIKLIFITLFFLGLGIEKIIIAQELPCYSTVLLQQGFSKKVWQEKISGQRLKTLRALSKQYEQLDKDIFGLLTKQDHYGQNKHLFGSYHANFDYSGGFEGREAPEEDWFPVIDFKNYDYKPSQHWLLSPSRSQFEMKNKIDNFDITRTEKFSYLNSYLFLPLALRIGIERQMVINTDINQQKVLVFVLEEDDVFKEAFLQSKDFFAHMLATNHIQVVMLLVHRKIDKDELVDTLDGVVDRHNLFFVDFSAQSPTEIFYEKKIELLQRIDTIIQCNRA